MHRVTPVRGEKNRIQVVLAYNTESGVALSEQARLTFYGRVCLSSIDQNVVRKKIYDFLFGCAKAMELCAEGEIQQTMVERLLSELSRSEPLDFEPNPLPVLHNKKWVKDMKLAKDFREFADFLPWRHSPRSLNGSNENAIMNFRSLFNLGGVFTGLIYVDSDKTYPEHNHAQDEMYFLISGTAQWRFGGNHDYQSLTAGNVIYNYPWNWHGVKAGPTPVLALYLTVIDPG